MVVVSYVLCVVTTVRGKQKVNVCQCAVETGFPVAERVVWHLPRWCALFLLPSFRADSSENKGRSGGV